MPKVSDLYGQEPSSPSSLMTRGKSIFTPHYGQNQARGHHKEAKRQAATTEENVKKSQALYLRLLKDIRVEQKENQQQQLLRENSFGEDGLAFKGTLKKLLDNRAHTQALQELEELSELKKTLAFVIWLREKFERELKSR